MVILARCLLFLFRLVDRCRLAGRHTYDLVEPVQGGRMSCVDFFVTFIVRRKWFEKDKPAKSGKL